MVQRCESVAADRGFDDGKLIGKLWQDWEALPIVDIRNCWRDGEATRVAAGWENVVYDYRGTVSCVCPRTGTLRQMAYAGLERERGTPKYRCPIGRTVRISMAQEPRVFTPLPRHSYKWRRMYPGRTAVERVNSLLKPVA